MKNKPGIIKRALAFLVDSIIVLMISNMIFMIFNSIFNFKTTKTDEYAKQGEVLADKFTNEEIDENEYLSEYYKLQKEYYRPVTLESIPYNLVNLVVMIAYFIILNYYLNGQTFGKKLFNIRIVGKRNKKLSINSYILRGIVCYGMYVTVLEMILVFLIKGPYYQVSLVIEAIEMVILLISIVMIIFNEDKRGIHDYIAGTKVVND